MSITPQFIGKDGKTMTPDQVEISRLKKSNESLSQKYADLEKRIADLEAKQQKAEREASRGPKF
jgi:FtsZ-binding cell division protein ZapB